MQHVPLKVLEEGKNKKKLLKRPPFATIVTDLSEGCHHLWFHKDVDRCFVPIDEVKAKAMQRGLKEEKIRVCGLPVRPAFSSPLPSKPDLRLKLGLNPTAKVALLVGGGEGMGPVEKTVSVALVEAQMSKHI
jgi:1,2-diacylglycerol 3-beta-galactosyltransferase